MRTLLPLLRREWLQHRTAWMLAAGIPFGLALLAAVFAQLHVDIDQRPKVEHVPLLAALVTTVATTMVTLVIAVITSAVVLSGLARRDHGDRSVEFWLSLPIAHHRALGVPLLTHGVLVPAAAVVIGWMAGQLLTLVVVSRVSGLGAWWSLPWPQLAGATLALVLRLLAGLPLAALWAMPVVLLVVLLGAWFKRWGWVVLLVGVGLLELFDRLTLGQRWLLDNAAEMLRRAGLSLLGAGGKGVSIRPGEDPLQALAQLPTVVLHDFGAALAWLATPLMPGALLCSALAFALLLRWRQRGAGLGD